MKFTKQYLKKFNSLKQKNIFNNRNIFYKIKRNLFENRENSSIFSYDKIYIFRSQVSQLLLSIKLN